MTESKLRMALWISVPFNLVAALLLAFPDSVPGRLVGLPAPVPLPYRTLLAFFVLLFGAAYAWMAVQARIDRPLLALAGIGKMGVFALALILWLADALSGRVVLLASGDFALALVFLAGARMPAGSEALKVRDPPAWNGL